MSFSLCVCACACAILTLCEFISQQDSGSVEPVGQQPGSSEGRTPMKSHAYEEYLASPAVARRGRLVGPVSISEGPNLASPWPVTAQKGLEELMPSELRKNEGRVEDVAQGVDPGVYGASGGGGELAGARDLEVSIQDFEHERGSKQESAETRYEADTSERQHEHDRALRHRSPGPEFQASLTDLKKRSRLLTVGGPGVPDEVKQSQVDERIPGEQEDEEQAISEKAYLPQMSASMAKRRNMDAEPLAHAHATPPRPPSMSSDVQRVDDGNRALSGRGDGEGRDSDAGVGDIIDRLSGRGGDARFGGDGPSSRVGMAEWVDTSYSVLEEAERMAERCPALSSSACVRA